MSDLISPRTFFYSRKNALDNNQTPCLCSLFISRIFGVSMDPGSYFTSHLHLKLQLQMCLTAHVAFLGLIFIDLILFNSAYWILLQ